MAVPILRYRQFLTFHIHKKLFALIAATIPSNIREREEEKGKGEDRVVLKIFERRRLFEKRRGSYFARASARDAI